MPALGLQQDTGTVIAWLKEEGESVIEGEPILEIETDKASVEIEAPASGILAGICAREGDQIPVGQVVAWIVAHDESVPKGSQEAPSPPLLASPVARKLAEQRGVDLAQVPASGKRIGKDDVLRYLASVDETRSQLAPASPKARRLARERGLEVEHLTGTGPGGAVLAADVPPAESEQRRPSSIWQLMADRVSQSWRGAPHFFLLREVNASRLVAWRRAAQQHIGPELTYTDLLIKVVAATLSCHPETNASWRDGAIEVHREINVGLAAAVSEGLVVPVVHRADELNLSQIMARRQDLLQRAQAGKLSFEDLANGTFTVSNLGMYGVDAFLAILNPPQAALLTVGRIADRVVALDGRPAVQPTMMLSLSCDHRVIDGARGAQFLATLARFLEEPLLLGL